MSCWKRGLLPFHPSERGRWYVHHSWCTLFLKPPTHNGLETSHIPRPHFSSEHMQIDFMFQADGGQLVEDGAPFMAAGCPGAKDGPWSWVRRLGRTGDGDAQIGEQLVVD